jgi:hypothetical protein
LVSRGAREGAWEFFRVWAGAPDRDDGEDRELVGLGLGRVVGPEPGREDGRVVGPEPGREDGRVVGREEGVGRVVEGRVTRVGALKRVEAGRELACGLRVRVGTAAGRRGEGAMVLAVVYRGLMLERPC